MLKWFHNTGQFSPVHESPAVQEAPEVPRHKLRENFESSSEQESRSVKTWDVENDLMSRSVEVKNVIDKHETIAVEEAPKSEKKITGILKKTSTSNVILTTTVDTTEGE